AMVVLGSIFATELLRVRGSSRRRLAVFAAVVFFSASFLTFAILCAAASVSAFHLRSAAARLGQSGVLFSQVMDTSRTIKSGNYPRPFFVRENADALDRIHLLRTPLVRTREISKMRHGNAGEGMAAGWFDGLTTETMGLGSRGGG